MEKCHEHNTKLHLLFVDFRQVFDSVHKDGLYWYMERKGIPKKFIRLIKTTLNETKAKVMIDGRKGIQFDLTRGVRQGDALSATLFNMALQRVLEKLNGTGNIIYKSSQVCAYADDVVLIARSETILIEMITELMNEGKKMRLEVNPKKTKYMITEKILKEAEPTIYKCKEWCSQQCKTSHTLVLI